MTEPDSAAPAPPRPALPQLARPAAGHAPALGPAQATPGAARAIGAPAAVAPLFRAPAPVLVSQRAAKAAADSPEDVVSPAGTQANTQRGRKSPAARVARLRKRHSGLMLAFVVIVILPVLTSAFYLYTFAADQYASSLGFTVRSEDVSSASDILGGLGSTLGSSSSRDTDILYEFIRSQELVATIDARIDLHTLYSKERGRDPLLAFAPGGTIEDLTRYWQRMVRISYDAGAGLMELRILAFTATDAKAIAEAVQDESSKMINGLSTIAREDATRYAGEELERAEARLRQAREALTAFRVANQIVDVTADIQGQMGLLNTLQAQLASALIEFDLLSNTQGASRETDPRLVQAQRRIEVIEARIDDERRKFGSGGQGPGPDGESYATTVAEFERLTVDREFAERAYLAALSAYDGARAEANRQSRYLAAYIRPTLAERAEFPQRSLLIGLVALFSFLTWAIAGLVFYSLRDS